MRTAFSVIAGYLVLALWVAITLTVAWLLTGPEFAYHRGTTNVTPAWVLLTLPLNFVGALLGGLTARRIGGDRAVRVLAALILILGLGLAAAHIVMDRPAPPRPVEQMTVFEAASYAVQPVWYDFLVPFVGVAGVLMNLRRAGREDVAAA